MRRHPRRPRRRPRATRRSSSPTSCRSGSTRLPPRGARSCTTRAAASAPCAASRRCTSSATGCVRVSYSEPAADLIPEADRGAPFSAGGARPSPRATPGGRARVTGPLAVRSSLLRRPPGRRAVADRLLPAIRIGGAKGFVTPATASSRPSPASAERGRAGRGRRDTLDGRRRSSLPDLPRPGRRGQRVGLLVRPVPRRGRRCSPTAARDLAGARTSRSSASTPATPAARRRRGFAAQLRGALPQHLRPGGHLAAGLPRDPHPAVPSTVVIDAQGRVAAACSGRAHDARPWCDLVEDVAREGP